MQACHQRRIAWLRTERCLQRTAARMAKVSDPLPPTGTLAATINTSDSSCHLIDGSRGKLTETIRRCPHHVTFYTWFWCINGAINIDPRCPNQMAAGTYTLTDASCECPRLPLGTQALAVTP